MTKRTKWLACSVGCLVMLVILGAIGGLVAAGFYGYKTAVSFQARTTAATTAMAKLDADYPFALSTFNTTLDQERYAEYLAASSALDKNLAAKKDTSAAIKVLITGKMPPVGFSNMFTIWGEIVDVMLEAAEDLDARSMSPREFAYYHHLTMRTIRAGAEAGDPDMVALWKDLQTSAANIDAAIGQVQQFTTRGPAATGPQFNFRTMNGVTTYTYTGPALPILVDILDGPDAEVLAAVSIPQALEPARDLVGEADRLAVEAFLVSVTETHMGFSAPADDEP